MQESKKIFYDVKIKERYMMEELYKTKIKQYFTASIVGKLEHNFYFELKDSEEILIIPYCYIEWLSPTKVDDKKKLAKFSKREVHAYQNDDGTYKVEILEDKLITEIEKADIYITVYATKDGNRMISFTEKE